MCGRYSIFASPAEIETHFDATVDYEFRPRYNAAPRQSLPILRDATPSSITESRWGLLPEWADDESGGLINARAETLDEKPAFREAYRQRRCLVLADGFYEWADRGDGRRPYRIAREDGEPFAMAGLYERWTPPTRQAGLGDFGDGAPAPPDPIETFTVVTREPTPFARNYHHRMALVLAPGDERAWLDGADVDAVDVPADDALCAYPVSTAVNDPANDRPEVTEEV
jgi:putative SOS response-associated peptidase YedK